MRRTFAVACKELVPLSYGWGTTFRRLLPFAIGERMWEPWDSRTASCCVLLYRSGVHIMTACCFIRWLSLGFFQNESFTEPTNAKHAP